MKLCFATHNRHKLEEIKSMLGSPYGLLSLAEIGCTEELPETTGTIAGNSHQKAEYVFAKYGVACFADDSGLEVEALQGAPGVDSAFYAGPQKSDQDNVALLLHNLKGVANRSARFITVITLVSAAQKIWQFEGILKGEITDRPRGVNGFGYDPVFLPAGATQTLAEMDLAEKNSISHRAQAMKQFLSFLHKELDSGSNV
ncbi:MAG: RdgB/HAM1 family non-canonical purine NTP pyrophosphatase [Bacteroidetes bacterium]|nr:RdgB/HAM1 family non-canonical purine NTP pyrophosphatase [Bacteroidota bacterium]